MRRASRVLLLLLLPLLNIAHGGYQPLPGNNNPHCRCLPRASLALVWVGGAGDQAEAPLAPNKGIHSQTRDGEVQDAVATLAIGGRLLLYTQATMALRALVAKRRVLCRLRCRLPRRLTGRRGGVTTRKLVT